MERAMEVGYQPSKLTQKKSGCAHAQPLIPKLPEGFAQA